MKRYVRASFSEPDDVYMLMRYYPDSGENGMSGDMYICQGKFFASSLPYAKHELEVLKKTCPRLQGNFYVTEYNDYFDPQPESEDDIDMNPSAWGGEEYNVFANLETLVHYLGLDGPAYSDDAEELPFTI